MLRPLALALCLTLLAFPALAKDARCYSSDDGEYDCSFENLDGDGSFEIRADGYPTFQLTVNADGTAYGMAQFGPEGRFVALPGTYVRNVGDGACWDNDETGTQICAW